MRFLRVRSEGSDYGALSFREHFNGWEVSDVIEKIFDEVGQTVHIEIDEYTDFVMELHEADTSDEFFHWIKREMLDYDHQKHEDIFEENEKIVW